VIGRGDDDDGVPAAPGRLTADPARLSLGAVRVGVEAEDAPPPAEAVRLVPAVDVSVRDREDGRDARPPEPDAFGQPVPAGTREDDDRIRLAGDWILGGPDEEIGRRGDEQGGDEREQEPRQWAIARSTASSSSGERATEGRPRSSSFM
jgi:hypothetical protein